LHVRHDERTAGFLALGLATVSGRPVPVFVTSGSAGAHLAAATVEAAQAGIPLILVTADRPAALIGTGANQTIPQRELLVGAGAALLELPELSDAAAAATAWAQGARSAVGTAWHTPGPVHVNASFAEPLAPDDDWADIPAARAVPVPPRGEVEPTPNGWGVAGRRGVVLAGPAPGVTAAGVAQLARALGFPVLAEPALAPWPADVVYAPAGLITRRHPHLFPDVVVAIGRVGLSRGEAALLLDADVVAIAPPPGVTRSGARLVLPGMPSTAAIAAEAARADAPADWLPGWRTAAVATADQVAAVCAANPDSSLNLARAVADALRPGMLLHLAASLPARDFATVATNPVGSAMADGPIRVTMNRGANGIDGLVSTAIGAALAWQATDGGPAIAYLGDIATLHDLPGFVVAAGEPTPDLTFVISDNDGGAIFSTLEQRDAAGFERVFGTPHARDLVAVLTALGLPTQRVAIDEVAAALGVPHQGLRALVVRTLDRHAEGAVRTALLA
jgi:2-succinyl-5-enolpyruvyl-6-hydroxy-3-cyclohexene-1-carboxylate synthase